MCGYSCAILFVLVDVVEKFRRGLDAGDQQMITGASADRGYEYVSGKFD